MIIETIKKYMEKTIKIFDPLVSLIGITFLIILEAQLLQIYLNTYTVAIVCLIKLGAILIYFSTLASFEIFDQCQKNQRCLIFKIFCCQLGEKLKQNKMEAKFKKWILLMNIVIAVIITIITQITISNKLQQESSVDLDTVKRILSNINFLFWILILYEIVLGCLKLSIILALLVLFSPCIVVFVIKNNGQLPSSNGSTIDGKYRKIEFKKIFRMLFFNKKTYFRDVKETAANQETCSICLENFKDEDEVVKLNCNQGHIFHFGCIEGWANHNNSCPLCRQNLVAEQDIQNNLRFIDSNASFMNQANQLSLRYQQASDRYLIDQPNQVLNQTLRIDNQNDFENNRHQHDSQTRVHQDESTISPVPKVKGGKAVTRNKGSTILNAISQYEPEANQVTSKSKISSKRKSSKKLSKAHFLFDEQGNRLSSRRNPKNKAMSTIDVNNTLNQIQPTQKKRPTQKLSQKVFIEKTQKSTQYLKKETERSKQLSLESVQQ